MPFAENFHLSFCPSCKAKQFTDFVLQVIVLCKEEELMRLKKYEEILPETFSHISHQHFSTAVLCLSEVTGILLDTTSSLKRNSVS